jgi:myo-inositol-1(or 4)-monophosphatase
MTALFSRSAEPVDPGLLSRALEVAGRLANDAAEVIAATAVGAGRVGTGRIDEHAEAHLYDWVTDTDRTLERHTRRVLVGEFPDVPVVGPEYGTEHVAGSEQTRYRWLVAPLDGVANYRAGLPWYGHALALVDASGPVVGVVSDPGRGEIYAAARGRGARVNGVPVRIPDGLAARRLPGAIPVCVEPPLGGWAARFLARAAEARFPVRVLGSVALAIAQVALGHAAAAVLEDYQEWEVAAGLALALEAGAVVLDRSGRPDPMPAGGLLVAAPSAASVVLDRWRAAASRTTRSPAEPEPASATEAEPASPAGPEPSGLPRGGTGLPRRGRLGGDRRPDRRRLGQRLPGGLQLAQLPAAQGERDGQHDRPHHHQERDDRQGADRGVAAEHPHPLRVRAVVLHPDDLPGPQVARVEHAPLGRHRLTLRREERDHGAGEVRTGLHLRGGHRPVRLDLRVVPLGRDQRQHRHHGDHGAEHQDQRRQPADHRHDHRQ